MGEYYVTILETTSFCAVVARFEVPPASGDAPFTLSISPTQSTCYGGNTGALSVAVDVQGFDPNDYTYEWFFIEHEIIFNLNTANFVPIGTTQEITGLEVGWYSVTVTSLDGCSASDVFILWNAPNQGILVNGIMSPVPNCNNSPTTLTAEVTNGSEDYHFEWYLFPASDPIATTSINSIVVNNPGNYYVRVTDKVTGCVRTELFTIPETKELEIEADIANNCDDGNGEIDLLINGGNPPYNILWNTGATTASISELTAGDYTVTVTDASNCSTTQTFSVTYGGNLSISLDEYNYYSLYWWGEEELGSVTITGTGGSGEYTYQWSNGGTTPTISDLLPGTYFLTVTDVVNGCILEVGIPIDCSNDYSLSADIPIQLMRPCDTPHGGEMTVVPEGIYNNAYPDEMSYSWSGPAGSSVDTATTATIDGLTEPGEYCVTVTDFCGTSATACEILICECGTIGAGWELPPPHECPEKWIIDEIFFNDDWGLTSTQMANATITVIGPNNQTMIIDPIEGSDGSDFEIIEGPESFEIDGAGYYCMDFYGPSNCHLWHTCVTVFEEPQSNLIMTYNSLEAVFDGNLNSIDPNLRVYRSCTVCKHCVGTDNNTTPPLSSSYCEAIEIFDYGFFDTNFPCQGGGNINACGRFITVPVNSTAIQLGDGENDCGCLFPPFTITDDPTLFANWVFVEFDCSSEEPVEPSDSIEVGVVGPVGIDCECDNDAGVCTFESAGSCVYNGMCNGDIVIPDILVASTCYWEYQAGIFDEVIYCPEECEVLEWLELDVDTTGVWMNPDFICPCFQNSMFSPNDNVTAAFEENFKDEQFNEKNNSDTEFIEYYSTSFHKLKVYPNPFQNNFDLEINVSEESEIKIQIFNLLGNQFLIENHSVYKGKNNFELNPNLPNGVYQVLVTDEKGNYSTQRIVKANN